jgi:hypothetical protein
MLLRAQAQESRCKWCNLLLLLQRVQLPLLLSVVETCEIDFGQTHVNRFHNHLNRDVHYFQSFKSSAEYFVTMQQLRERCRELLCFQTPFEKEANVQVGKRGLMQQPETLLLSG